MRIITGTGRSGTKTAARMFGAEHEYRTHPYKPGALIWPWFQDKGNLNEPWPDREARLREHLDGVTLKSFFDSSNLYLHFLHVLKNIDPEVRVLYTWRDPFDFIRSTYFRGWHERAIWSFSPSPDKDGAEYCDLWAFGAWEDWPPVRRLAWIWTKRNRIGKSLIREHGIDAFFCETSQLYKRAGDIDAFFGITPKDSFSRDGHAYHNTKPKDPIAWANFWQSHNKADAFLLAGFLQTWESLINASN